MRRRLDAELVRRGLAPSRARAHDVIRAGRVRVGGAPTTSVARQVGPAEPIAVAAPPRRFVSRGGEKLAAALDRFGLDPTGARALDAGASTGGFTDCLVQRGAAEVVAVDVGHGQLAWTLRTERRVRVLERTNVRFLEPATIGGPVDLVTADLAFISLLVVAPALVRCATPTADLVLLVKPQFEAGRSRVGRGGVVRDPAVHRAVLDEVVTGLARDGLDAVAVMPSPLVGAEGNVEFVLHCRPSVASPPAAPLEPAALDAAVAEASRS